MRVIQHQDPIAFRDRAMPTLLEHECENCSMIGIIGRLVEGKSPVKSGAPTVPLLLSVEDENGRVASIAIQTPPHALLISPSNEDAICALIKHLIENDWRGDEIVATIPTIHLAADAFGEITGRTWARHRGLRVMRADAVIDPLPVNGSLRVATEQDLALITQWSEAFARDIGEGPGDPAATARIVISEQRAHLWGDDDAAATPRSMCSWAGPTPNGVRVNLVYTPPEYRGRGHASSATAELTRRMLASGKKFCFLFTDADNPTSNRIYQRIGYRPVAEFEHVKFSTLAE